MRKNGSVSPKGSEAAGKARNPEKRAFLLPYVSYNLHYTKYYKNQKQRPPSPAFNIQYKAFLNLGNKKPLSMKMLSFMFR